jgi:predicted nucleotidyltransferase
MAKKRKNKKRKPATLSDRTFYALNRDFEFFDELRSLILKSSPAEKDKMIKKISGLGGVKLAIASGVFMSDKNFTGTLDSDVDLFIVADHINKNKLRSFLKALEAEVGKEIRFGLMERQEFQYRHGMFDRFVRVLLESPHEKLINKLGL